VKYLLDTNILSELTKPAPLARVVSWVNENQGESAFSAITLGELKRGVEFLTDGRKKNALRRAVQFFHQDYTDRVLAFDEWVAATWARYCGNVKRAGFTITVLDSQIAATAVHYELHVVTANANHFPLVGVVNPFQA